jgi:opacity protein-like surface antigen
VAKDVTIVPSITFAGVYDDNVYFTGTDEISDYLAIISPALTFDYASELFNLKANGIVDVLRYADESDLNTENQRYALDAGYQFMERWALSGNFSYIKDTTLDSELEETGIVNFRDDRESYNAGAGLSYQISELSDIGVSYTYEDMRYKDSDLDDYYASSISLPYNRKFNDGLDIFTVEPRYVRLSSDTSDDVDYRLTLGWTHSPNETYRLRIFLGARYTVQDYKDGRDTTSNWGGVADISLLKTAEIYSVLMGFNSDFFNEPSTGELNKLYRIYCNLTRRFTERLGAGVNATFSLAQPDDEDAFNDKDIWYFVVEPSLTYQLTENHSLQLSYSYQQEYDKNLEDDRRSDRNMVWLSLIFNFPRKL